MVVCFKKTFYNDEHHLPNQSIYCNVKFRKYSQYKKCKEIEIEITSVDDLSFIRFLPTF